MVMRQREAARSMPILETDAPSSLDLRISRILRSSASNLPNSFFSANHFEVQSLLTATRRPIGFVFWPIGYSSDRTILTWQLRFRIGPAEPRALGMKRLMVVAVPATASLTRNRSVLKS